LANRIKDVDEFAELTVPEIRRPIIDIFCRYIVDADLICPGEESIDGRLAMGLGAGGPEALLSKLAA
jgi:hypothetical protein